MFGKPKPKPLVGLDIGSSSVKLVELRKKGEAYELLNIGMDTLDPDTVVDGAIMNAPDVAKKIQDLFTQNKIKVREVATGVSGHSVIVKKIVVAAASEAEVAQAIDYEAQQNVPFDIADVYKDYQVLGLDPSGHGFEVMLVAVKREKVTNHQNVLNIAGVIPSVLDIDAFAVQNAFELCYQPPAEQLTALLNVGASIMNIDICKGGTPHFTRDVSVGGNQYTDTLQKELDLSFDDAEKLKKGQEVSNVTAEQRASHIHSVTEILLLEIQKTFDYFRQTTSTEAIQHIFLSGGSARIEGLVDALKDEFHIPVEILNPFQGISVGPKIDTDYVNELAPRMAVAVGLALRSFDAS